MQRDAMAELVKWKNSARRKPLVLNGARQVGKTWLLREFGKRHFDNVAYVNFDSDASVVKQFDLDFDTGRLITALQAHTHEKIQPHKTLVIFDEIQECPAALTSLKYFCENAHEYAVCAAGSLLGVTVHSGSGYPVGKVSNLDLHPLTFFEFLDAVGEGQLRELISASNLQTLVSFHEKLKSLLRTYCFVGGMPEAVCAFADSGNLDEARDVQRDILLGYERDISKHLSPKETEHCLAAFKSIPQHLGRENKKFVFGNIASGARASNYRFAITWMVQAGIALRVPRASKPGVPLGAYSDDSAFKLFMCDVGLLGASSGIDAGSVIDGNRIFTEFKGALAEQYVCQQLFAAGFSPSYWSARNSTGEIDFLVQRGGRIYPIEVKAEENLRAKSLRAFNERFDGVSCRRLSGSPYREQDWMVNVPLYAACAPDVWG